MKLEILSLFLCRLSRIKGGIMLSVKWNNGGVNCDKPTQRFLNKLSQMSVKFSHLPFFLGQSQLESNLLIH